MYFSFRIRGMNTHEYSLRVIWFRLFSGVSVGMKIKNIEVTLGGLCYTGNL